MRERKTPGKRCLCFQDIALNDIFLQCAFVMDEKERVLNVIHAIRPNFQPCLTHSDSSYQPSILEPLNSRPSTVLKDTPYRGVLPDHNLSVALLKEQLKLEMKGSITVKSVDALAEPDAKVLRYRRKIEKLKDFWTTSLLNAFERNMEALKLQFRHKKGINIYPFMCTLKTSDCIQILQEVL
jgi:hypothetical protein